VPDRTAPRLRERRTHRVAADQHGDRQSAASAAHEETREPVEPEDKGRGYEVAKGQYLIVEEKELESIEIESVL
jgi:DNA end-binding protein Ku